MFVFQVSPSSLAATASLLVGDTIVEINGIKTEGLTHQQTLDTVRQCGDQLRLSVIR